MIGPQVLAENIEEEFDEIEREAREIESHGVDANRIEENNFDGLLPLHPDAIKLEPEAPEDSVKRVFILYIQTIVEFIKA